MLYKNVGIICKKEEIKYTGKFMEIIYIISKTAKALEWSPVTLHVEFVLHHSIYSAQRDKLTPIR